MDELFKKCDRCGCDINYGEVAGKHYSNILCEECCEDVSEYDKGVRLFRINKEKT
jgi:hypothetical protein